MSERAAKRLKTDASQPLITICTWNILSQKLAGDFPWPPKQTVALEEVGDEAPATENGATVDKEGGSRYDAIIECLQTSIQQQCVLCLQEVEEDFSVRLAKIFHLEGYESHWVARGGTPEKRELTGNMGWLVAYPTSLYTEVKCVKDMCIGKDEEFWKNTGIKPQTIVKYEQEMTIYERLAEYFDITPVYVRLQHKSTKQCIGIATFHMPCEFQMPMVAAGMAVLLCEWLTEVNKENGGDPYVLVGDMNSTTEDPTYKFITNPTNKDTDNEKILHDLARECGMSSFNGLVDVYEGCKERPTTNTYIRDEKEYHSAIDYIFHTPSLDAVTKSIGSLPKSMKAWPSDHKMVQASLVLSCREEKDSG